MQAACTNKIAPIILAKDDRSIAASLSKRAAPQTHNGCDGSRTVQRTGGKKMPNFRLPNLGKTLGGHALDQLNAKPAGVLEAEGGGAQAT